MKNTLVHLHWRCSGECLDQRSRK